MSGVQCDISIHVYNISGSDYGHQNIHHLKKNYHLRVGNILLTILRHTINFVNCSPPTVLEGTRSYSSYVFIYLLGTMEWTQDA